MTRVRSRRSGRTRCRAAWRWRTSPCACDTTAGNERPRPRLGGVDRVVPSEHHQARRQARDVPLERTREGLVEVAEIERQVPLRRRPQTEVEDVCISTHLHHESGVRSRREVGCHDRSCPSEERPGRCHHAAEANRHEVGETTVVLRFQSFQGAAETERRVDDSEPCRGARCRASRPTARRSLGDVPAELGAASGLPSSGTSGAFTMLTGRTVQDPAEAGITRCAGPRSPGRSPAAGSRSCPRRSCGSWHHGASAPPGTRGCSRNRRGSGWPPR